MFIHASLILADLVDSTLCAIEQVLAFLVLHVLWLLQDLRYQPGDWLLFGAETFGLPSEALEECREGTPHGAGLARIPIDESYVRSLNLAVSVGVGVYEALRQLGTSLERE